MVKESNVQLTPKCLPTATKSQNSIADFITVVPSPYHYNLQGCPPGEIFTVAIIFYNSGLNFFLRVV